MMLQFAVVVVPRSVAVATAMKRVEATSVNPAKRYGMFC